MKFFQKRWVAITLCVIMILSSFGISWSKQKGHSSVPDDTDVVASWGKENYNAYMRYVSDDANLLSEGTEKKLAVYNAWFDYRHGSICGVATVKQLDGQSMEDAAEHAAERLALGSNDYLLLLDKDTQVMHLYCGEEASEYNNHRLDRLVAEEMDDMFRDTDDAMLDLFDDLEDWYEDTVPFTDRPSNAADKGTTVLGTILFVVLLLILVFCALISSMLRAGRRLIRGWMPTMSGKKSKNLGYREPSSGSRSSPDGFDEKG